MTVTVLMVRHAAHDNVGGFLAGRMEGVSLGPAGRSQAARLGERMRGAAIDAIHSSPRERCRETAEAIASACGLPPPRIAEELDEIDFGRWSGSTFAELDADPLWRRWNTVRSCCRTPGGESMLDVQQRALRYLEPLVAGNAGRRLAVVSHADVIKAIVMHVLGLAIDAWPRFDVSPASVTTIAAGEWGAKLLNLNEVVS